jgi:DNA-binding MarR family transcriptional regulator
MSFRDFSRYFRKGNKISRAFINKGVTPYQACALLKIYENRGGTPRDQLKGATQVSNEGQFSRSVIMPLIERGYIKRQEKQEGDKRAHFSMLPEGSELVEAVMEETGYSNQTENPP